MRRPGSKFTLIELVVVITIICLAAAFIAVRFRTESPTQILDGAVRGFEGFCSQVRYRSAEDGCDWLVRYNVETRLFTAARQERKQIRVNRDSDAVSVVDTEADERESVRKEVAEEKAEAEAEESGVAVGGGKTVLKWYLPEKVILPIFEEEETDLEPDEEGTYEVFRFFPDGAASGNISLVFKIGEICRTVSISTLTGFITHQDGEPESENSEQKRIRQLKEFYGEKY